MRAKGKFCDAQIVVQGKQINCHRNILAASSEYFEKMFAYSFLENKDNISKIFLDKDQEYGFSDKVVEAVLYYLYTGFLPSEIELNLISNIFVLSQMWLLPDIQNICIKIMCENIDKQNFKEFLDFSDKFSAMKLQSEVLDFMVRNLPRIFKVKEFSELNAELFLKMLDDPRFICHKDLKWLEAIKYWSKKDESRLLSALQKIPFGFLTKDQLELVLADKSIVNNKEIYEMILAKV